MPLLDAGDIAEAISFAVERPGHVNVSSIVVYPTRQP